MSDKERWSCFDTLKHPHAHTHTPEGECVAYWRHAPRHLSRPLTLASNFHPRTRQPNAQPRRPTDHATRHHFQLRRPLSTRHAQQELRSGCCGRFDRAR
jgi:hypothetical protein